MKLSILDLSPVRKGHKPADALKDSIQLAKFADTIGYYRYWFAEHHSMPGISTTSPEIMLSQIAMVTKNLRLGSGGIMLPNHSPLKVAENFRTLMALHPGRIDLGLGRAPGTDMKTTLVLRRNPDRVKADHFTEELAELIRFLREGQDGVVAMPQVDEFPELWLLGSSDFSARLSARMGLPFSFADHFSAYPASPIIDLYRESFRPSEFLDSPRTMLGAHVICAATDEEARRLSLSSDYSFFRLRQYGVSEPLLSVEEIEDSVPPEQIERMRAFGMKKFVGSPKTVREKLTNLLEQTGVDELIVTSFIYDQEARKESYRLLINQFAS